MEQTDYSELKLGKSITAASSPDVAILDVIQNPKKTINYLVRFTCPEFTSLCPVTGQPDFAHIVVDYIPNEQIVESKSLKLYLESYRNYSTFHEDCTISIGEKLITAIDPIWLRIGGYWYPRGGIPIDVFFQTGEPPAGVWVPDQGVKSYKGRG